MRGIDWRDIQVGEKYRYEEKYYTQAEVTVLEEVSSIKNSPNYKAFRIRVDKPYCGCESGEIMTVGRIVKGEGMYLVQDMKFKALNEPFDYGSVSPKNALNR